MTQLDLTTLPPRIRAHKESLIHIVQPPVCTERARHYTQAYQAHLARPLPVRRALALAHHLKERTIWIKHDELIVGNQASQVRAAPLFPEYTVGWIEKEIDELADRPGAGFAVSEADKLAIHALTPFWRGQTVQDRCYGLFTDEQKGLLESGIIKAEGNMTSGDAHLAVNYEQLLALGLDGLKSKVAERRGRLDLADWADLQREQFLQAVAITFDAVSQHIERYAALAHELAPPGARAQSAAASLRPSRSTAPTSPTGPPRPSGRRCSSATSSSSSCRSSPTATRCRLAGWTSTSTPGIAARWNCRNPCHARAPSSCCKGAGSSYWR